MPENIKEIQTLTPIIKKQYRCNHCDRTYDEEDLLVCECGKKGCPECQAGWHISDITLCSTCMEELKQSEEAFFTNKRLVFCPACEKQTEAYLNYKTVFIDNSITICECGSIPFILPLSKTKVTKNENGTVTIEHLCPIRQHTRSKVNSPS